jgi:hypothetical protein
MEFAICIIARAGARRKKTTDRRINKLFTAAVFKEHETLISQNK